MPTSTFTPGDEKQDEKLNPGQQDYDRRFSDIAKAEERGTFDDIANNYDSSTADPAQEDANVRKLQERESASEPNAGWENNTSPTSSQKFNLKNFLKKRGPLIGISGGLGGTAMLFAMLFSPSLLLTNLMQTATTQNDSRSTILEKRLAQAIQQKMSPKSGACLTNICKQMSKMPESMLSAMEKKGITPVNADGTDFKYGNDTYVKENPYGYKYTSKTGETVTVQAEKFADEYKNVPEFRKLFKSAYNMRFLGYNGKYMLEKFFGKFKLKRNGGYANEPDFNESTANDTLDKALVSEADTLTEDGSKGIFKTRLQQLLDNSTKRVEKTGGDPILTVGTMACTAINMPRFIAGAYRAIQLSQVLILVTDTILSPGGMEQAGKGSADKIAAIGMLLTQRTKNSDGTLGKSALDSQILQSAIGVNKNKVNPSKYSPGYSLLTNSVVQTSTALAGDTKTACNVINSPQAAVAAAGIEGAISAASGGVGAIAIGALKGVGKITLAMGGVEAVMKQLEESGMITKVADYAYNAAKGVIGNYLEGAKGEALGDALGSGLLAYFSQAGSVGGAAPLKLTQVAGFTQAMADVNNQYKEEDIATLSPFDISSQYTFLGSIVSNLSLHSIQGNPFQSTLSELGYIVSSPLTILSSSVNAASNTADASCGYAETYGVDSSVAINAAGFPCVGIPSEYLDMPRDTVLSLVSDQIDPNTGEPNKNSDIASMESDCNNGDLESVAGCTISSAPTSSANITCLPDPNNSGQPCANRSVTIEGTDAQKRAAESLYLFDQQVENILNGQDDESNATTSAVATTASTTATVAPDNTQSQGQGWTLKEGADYSATACAPGTTDAGTYTHPIAKFTIRKCQIGNSYVNALVSGTAVAMIAAAQKDGVTLSISNSFRSYDEQQALYAKNCSSSGCSTQTASPGKSQHERGLAIDFNSCNTHSTSCYQWLNKNAALFGYYNLPVEAWHWSVSGN